ncbi:MDR family MFS transporter [Nocardiopsis sp. RSe5-2]|uniref:MDR family MFS transporter n=1 Tax=Nocardiopsis endophytica TaxID=3018445 RepID=A0ABT4UBB8_9ACTN|nr:MDR family MFS transporter [Nocardiopsis endophytica]MDA2814243.1 MDR family MFS transporter [Nocardiopsis endophytica]
MAERAITDRSDQGAQGRPDPAAAGDGGDGRDGPPGPRYTRRQVVEILAGLMLAMLTSMLTTSIVGTALPTIVGELGGQDKLSWVASATLLTMTASTPLWGKLSDIWGRKLLFQTALVIFIGSSVAAGFAQDMSWLIGARFVQGIGAGGLATLPQVILGDVVEPRERGRYAGFLGAVFGVSTVAGPLLGGFLVDSPLGWRWCFFITVPVAAAAFITIQRLLRLPKRPHGGAPVDWRGASCIVGAAGLAMLVLSLGGKEFDWNSAPTYLMSAGALVLAGLAVAAERRAADPILPPRLFADRTFLFSAAASMCVGMAMFGVMIYFPQYLQIVKGMSPTASGLMTLPMVLGLLTASVSSGFLVSRTGRWKRYPVAGMVLILAGFGVLSTLETGSSLVLVGAGVALIGLGLGLSMQILILAVQNALPRSDMAAATSAVSFFRNLGGAFGVAVFGAVMTERLHSELEAMARSAAKAAAASEAQGLPAPEMPHLSEKALGSPDAIHALPAVVQDGVIEAFNTAMHQVFILGMPIAAVGFVLVLFLRQAPLRSGTR